MKTPVLVGIALSAAAAATGFMGMGLPNHPYQWVLGAAVVAVCIHRRWLPFRHGLANYAVWALNALVLAQLFKIVIGGGLRTPFYWLRVPSIQASANGWLPKMGMSWETLALSQWQVDLTRVQCFLLLATAVGGWLRFQPFASITALFLMIVSIPAYADFQWDWVLPAMACAAASFYVQTSSVKPAPTR